MATQWYKGIPPVSAVLAHESLHPRSDGITWLNWLQVSYDEGDHRCIKGDDRLYGNWIINHKQIPARPYVSTGRLKVIDGEVFMALGMCSWLRMSTVGWKDEIECYPVGDNGLLIDYNK